MDEGMESRWYIPPGKSLSTTKIADRQLALHVTGKAWKNVVKHLDRKRLIQEEIDKNEAHRRALKEGSEAMTKNWPNSLEKVQETKDIAKNKKKEKEEKEKLEKYTVLRKEQEEMRKNFMADIKKKMFIEKQNPRNLANAFVFSHVLKERDKQVELNKVIKEKYRQQEDEYAEKVKMAALEEEMEKEAKRRSDAIKKQKFRETFLKEMKERELAEKEGRLQQWKEDAEDLRKAEEEYQKIQRIVKEEAIQNKIKYKKDFLEVLNQKRQMQKITVQEEQEQDEIINMVKESEARIKCLTKKKQKEIQDEMVERRIKISGLVMAEVVSKAEEEERILKKAEKERDEKEIAREQEKLQKQKEMQKEMQEYLKFFREKQSKTKEYEKEVERFEMLNRHKQLEVLNDYEKIKKDKNKQKTESYKKELLEQIEDNKKRFEQEREKEMNYVDTQYDDEDKGFFAYAQEITETLKNKGLEVFPVERVVQQYKKDNNLLEHQIKKSDKKTNMLNNTPGKMAHDPKCDPTYGKKNSVL